MVEVLSGPATHWRPAGHEAAGHARSVVALSRLPGSLGDDVGRLVAEQLGYQFYDREILRRIAESAQARECTVASLDEKDRPTLTDWLCALTLDSYLSPYGYREHLKRVLSAVARVGGAVILGRGAHLLLPPGSALRVLVVAPLPFRVHAYAEREGVALSEAERQVREQEAERRAFLRRHFHAELTDPLAFDLVLNTAVLGVEGATAAVVSALKRLPAEARTRA
jgi:cytidylate kinase